MAQPVFRLSSSSYSGGELEIVSFSGTEGISQLFEFTIGFKIAKATAESMDVSVLTTDDVELTVEDDTGEGQTHTVKGIFSSVEEVFKTSNTHKYFTGTLVPLLWNETHNKSYDIYVDKMATDVIQEEFDADFESDCEIVTSGEYPTREIITQYSETNFDFVSRTTEHWGIYYYFDHVDKDGIPVFADDTNYPELPIGTVKLDQSINPSQGFNSVRSLVKQYKAVPKGVIVSETHEDIAAEPFQGEAGEINDGKQVVHMADECCNTKEEADQIALIRLEELQRDKIVFKGAAGIPSLVPGYILNVETPNGDTMSILITEVVHSGNNLDNKARSQNASSLPYYQATFTGIPSDVQYRPTRKTERPNVISTTARVHSDSEDEQLLAQRNELGEYQVKFDFLKGEEGKISNWIRRASHTAHTNHLDMPLTPGTEVQIAFVGGNPDRPYILNALENSQSDIVPVNNENPHHASMITDGMLYTGALKSRQSLHMTANLDPQEVRDYKNNYPLDRLDAQGKTTGNPVDLIAGEVHVSDSYGDQYTNRIGNTFTYGINPTYNFGNQYVENHAYVNNTDNGTEEFTDGNSMLESADTSAAGALDDSLIQGLMDEQKAGLVQKDFGNKYNYHQGHAYNWSSGLDNGGIHKTFNFGGAYVENQCSSNTATPVDDMGSGFPSSPSDSDLITRTVGNTFDLQEGNQVSVLTGDVTSEMTGNTEETITGDTTSTITGNEEETRMGDVTSTHQGNTTSTIVGDQESTITGNITETHATGDVTVNRVGNTTEQFVGTVTTGTVSGESHSAIGMRTASFIGGYQDTAMAIAMETFVGGKISASAGPELDTNDKSPEIVNKTLVINNVSNTLIQKTNINIINASMTMVG